MATFSPMDPSSFSRPDLAVVTHIKISLEVSFERKIFIGSADLTINKINDSVNEVILDVRNLNIESIISSKLGDKLIYTISDTIDEYGSKLTIQLPPGEINDFLITISYETRPDASGLQWLDPQQTAGKAHPFVFSQFQTIHSRSFLPCQDTPGVKTKYEAMITSPSDLTVVMSAIRHGKHDSMRQSVYHFKQDVPVPAHLIAIAIGKLEHRRIGPRSTVWAEKEIVEAAAYEFANTEKQLKTAEDICGPYLWGVYDLLVLPPSFPLGAMENPCLTFVTPTLLAGDRSLANVIAHEIAHSWTGNLVTNANFEHFWLNEGFTVFIERKIMGRLEGKQVQDFQAYGGTKELQETVNELGKDNPLTNLVLDLKGIHPDNAFSIVPYEKGHTFLRYLENLVGGPDVFELFLRKYFDTYKYKCVTSDQFMEFFKDHFKGNAEITKIEWNTWLHKPGMPPVVPDYDKTLLKSIEDLKQRWLTWNETEDGVPFNINEIDSMQMAQLLQDIFEADPQPVKRLQMIEEKFKLNDIQNSEIKFRWLRLGIKAKWENIIKPTFEWVNEVGRMRYSRPLYRDLYGWESLRNEVITNFKEHRKNMMHVSAYSLAQDLQLH